MSRRIRRLCFAAFLVLLSTCPAAERGAARDDSFLQTTGGRLFFEECGSGEDGVILLHDGIVNSKVWDDVWPTFCRRFHTVRYDRPGYGRSPVRTQAHSEADDLLAVLRQTGVRRATLVASSHGASIAIDFALAHPGLVRRLVLVGPVVSGLPYTEHFIARGAAIFELVRKGDVTNGLKMVANDRYLIAPPNDTARRKLLDLLTANSQDATHADLALPLQSALPRLPEIHAPTLILVGEADIPDVHAHAGAIEAGIPGARRVVVKETGHLMYLEKPEEFTRLVTDFVDATGGVDGQTGGNDEGR